MTMNGQKRLTDEERARLGDREPIAHDDPTALSTAAGWSARANAAYDKPSDPVDHPSHYTSHPSGVECIAVVEHMTFNVGNAVKYLWRHGRKPSADAIEDLRKAEFYVRREIQRLGSEDADD